MSNGLFSMVNPPSFVVDMYVLCSENSSFHGRF